MVRENKGRKRVKREMFNVTLKSRSSLRLLNGKGGKTMLT